MFSALLFQSNRYAVMLLVVTESAEAAVKVTVGPKDLQFSALFTHHRTSVVVDSEISSEEHGTLSIQLFRSIDGGASFGFPDTPEEAAGAGLVSRMVPQDAYLGAIQREIYLICIENQCCWKADEIKLVEPELDTRRFMIYDQTKMLIGHVRQNATMSGNGFTHAFLTTESEWIDHVDAEFQSTPIVAAPGSCLVAVIWRGNLYVANVGDSQAVIGHLPDGSSDIVVQQLTRDDYLTDPTVRKEAQDLHPDEPGIVKKECGAWRIKGRVQGFKTAGEAYLKIPRSNLDNIGERDQLDTVLQNGWPATSADPSPIGILLQAQDRFVIFTYDGHWDLLSNEKAADIIQKNPKEGIAARLMCEDLVKVARNKRKRYDDTLNVKVESRNRQKLYDDDITVVVMLLNRGLQGTAIQEEFQNMSVKGVT